MVNMVKKLLLLSVFFSSLMFGGFQSALKKQKFLSPEEAFQVEAVQQGEQIVTTLTMADKIHIYKETIKFMAKGDKEIVLKPELSKAEELDGEMVYKGVLTIAIPTEKITSQISGDYTFSVEFQGCSDAGLCYSPIIKSYQFKGKELGVWEKIAKLSKEGNASKIVDVLINESSIFVLFLFFIFGLLLSLTPCIFPMIPILSSIIVSQQGAEEKASMGKAFFISFIYVLAMAMTYTIVGLVAGLVGADLQAAMQNPWVLTTFAGVFVALALSLFGYYEIGLPASIQSKLSKASDNAQGKGILGTAIMGALSALIVGPCTAAPISGAVLFISHTGDALLGGAALFVMSMGMGMPLLLVGLGAGKFMPRPGGWMTRVSQSFGVMMLALAIFMLSRILSEGTTMMLWALLFIGTAIYMGVFENKQGEGAMKLLRVLAMVFLLYGASLFIGALSGANSMLRPFEKFTSATVSTSSAAVVTEEKSSHLGYSVARLQAEIAASDKPVVVDFGKDSCTACKELEEITFPDPAVQEQLKHFTFIKVDLTANTDDDKAMLKEYGLFGTPNIIFFDKNNNYLPEKSLTGFVPPEQFAVHLKETI
ncbi:protein-disulfide reductase DsbD [Sulfurovum sp. zt1-1]|uniref:Protein-disulfide reductase DsbD n=1 Tax=Sulfurovum zhangzhouensis TaxID=3019067 RepID=A0ABT7QWF7_9BACT|nr:protein-disulfide reductase DsbD [Sulfurovum zhangzhouensis]MDM5271172.1 protein-disulfide reductase DsbD [Sulfurovum zhangzhouensis]